MDVTTLAVAKKHAESLALGGATPIPGPPGPPGQGVPTGGTTGQVLTKASNSNFDTKWAAPSGGGESGGISPELQEQLEMMILKTSPHLWEPGVEIDFKDGSFGYGFSYTILPTDFTSPGQTPLTIAHLPSGIQRIVCIEGSIANFNYGGITTTIPIGTNLIMASGLQPMAFDIQLINGAVRLFAGAGSTFLAGVIISANIIYTKV